jgi:hypothetical protein
MGKHDNCPGWTKTDDTGAPAVYLNIQSSLQHTHMYIYTVSSPLAARIE